MTAGGEFTAVKVTDRQTDATDWRKSSTSKCHLLSTSAKQPRHAPPFDPRSHCLGLQQANIFSGVLWSAYLFVYLSPCPRAYLRNYTSDIHQIFCASSVARSSSGVVAIMLGTCGFVDDVIFAYRNNGQKYIGDAYSNWTESHVCYCRSYSWHFLETFPHDIALL